jgi:hypothetical protein
LERRLDVAQIGLGDETTTQRLLRRLTQKIW